MYYLIFIMYLPLLIYKIFTQRVARIVALPEGCVAVLQLNPTSIGILQKYNINLNVYILTSHSI